MLISKPAPDIGEGSENLTLSHSEGKKRNDELKSSWQAVLNYLNGNVHWVLAP